MVGHRQRGYHNPFKTKSKINRGKSIDLANVCRDTVLDAIKSIEIQYPSVATVPKKEEGYDAGPMGYGKTREKACKDAKEGKRPY